MGVSRRNLLVGAGVTVPLAALALSRRPGESVPPAASAIAPAKVREVASVFDAQPTTDGAGVRLKRALGHRGLSMLDPFLMLDEFQTDDPDDYIAGFPDHPHRGFETVSYMIHGAMEHKDSVGNRGRLGPGSAQWMTAGHGIVHSEMPKQERGLMWGFQLWVNLPAASKMRKPRYQDIPKERIPEVAKEGALVRVVAGDVLGVTGPVTGIDVDPTFVDVALPKGAVFEHPLRPGHNAFVYLTDGSARIGVGRKEVRKGQLAVLAPGDTFLAEGEAASGRLLLLAGRPLHEPVARRGPFVMNTEEEIRTAIEDYRSGRLTAI
ncbi:MAG: pirin family protein [Polyangiaceae bacterium]